MSLCGERKAPPRPQSNAIRRQTREFTDQDEIVSFKRRIRAQVTARTQSLERLFYGDFVYCWRSHGILISLPQDCAPQLAFGVTHKTSARKLSF
jgi:hypothetical protein